jgi:hypothetical protein
MISDRTAVARTHVTKARHIITRQRELISEIRACGGDCKDADDLLSIFESSLVIFEDDLAATLKENSVV